MGPLSDLAVCQFKPSQTRWMAAEWKSCNSRASPRLYIKGATHPRVYDALEGRGRKASPNARRLNYLLKANEIKTQAVECAFLNQK